MIYNFIRRILKIIVSISPCNRIRVNILRLARYKIGKYVYVPHDLKISDRISNHYNIFIGDRVSIGPRVILITDSSPNNSKLIKKYPLISGKIKIENDSWIGAGVIILPNVTVGECSIIAAGSVVHTNIPPFSVVAGAPAGIIKKLNKDEL